MNVKMYLVVCILTVSFLISGCASKQADKSTPTLTSTPTKTPTPTAKPIATLEPNPDATATAAAQQTMDPRKYNARADGYFAKEKYVEAISDTIHALEADPKNQADPEVLQRAASSLARGTACDVVEAVDTLAQLPGAQKIMQKSLPMVLYECGQAQKKAGFLGEARQSFQRILDEFPSSNMKKSAETGLMEVDWVELVKTKGIAVAAEQVCKESVEKKKGMDSVVPKPYTLFISGEKGENEWNDMLPSLLMGNEETSVVICLSEDYKEKTIETCQYTGQHSANIVVSRIQFSRMIRFVNPIDRLTLDSPLEITGTEPDSCKYQIITMGGYAIYGDKPGFLELKELINKRLPPYAQATLSAYESASYAQQETILTEVNNKFGTDMILVPSGYFILGSEYGDDHEKPGHRVYLDSFFINRTEVTNAHYSKCVEYGNCEKPGCDYYGKSEYENHPVVCVDWTQAQTYCAWSGGRLPSEAEWEKAARGTDGREFPWGNEEPNCDFANYKGCKGDTTAVGSYPAGASPYGAFDMAGNVEEWVNDWFDDYDSSEKKNPMGPSSGEYRVLRGGSRYFSTYTLRAAARDHIDPGVRNNNIGFRCAMSAGD